MKSYTVVGYTSSSGEFICPDCSDLRETQDLTAVFADTEFDSYPVCDICGYKCTDITLTKDGVNYELSEIGRKLLNLAYGGIEKNFDTDLKESLEEIVSDLMKVAENI